MSDPFSPEVSDRICKHMNNDHAEAVLLYAKVFAQLEPMQRRPRWWRSIQKAWICSPKPKGLQCRFALGLTTFCKTRKMLTKL